MGNKKSKNKLPSSKTTDDRQLAHKRPVYPMPEALRLLYTNKVKPMEKRIPRRLLGVSDLTDAEFTCPPTVLILGETSVGKSTMIKYFLGTGYAGARYGHLQSTEAFFILNYGEKHRLVKLAVALEDPEFPFQSLARFGQTAYDNCFLCLVPSPLLKHVTIIDTPGIRPYLNPWENYVDQYHALLVYFASKADLTLFMFDALRPRQSDEVEKVLSMVIRFEGGIRIIINKVDSCNENKFQQSFNTLVSWLSVALRRRVMPKILLGSFWNRPLAYGSYRDRFEADLGTLYDDMKQLTIRIHTRRLNDIVRRAMRIRTIALIAREVYKLKKPVFGGFGKKSLERKLDKDIYTTVMKTYQAMRTDLPPVNLMVKFLRKSYRRKALMYNERAFFLLEEFLTNDVKRLIQAVRPDEMSESLEEDDWEEDEDEKASSNESDEEDSDELYFGPKPNPLTMAVVGDHNGWSEEFIRMRPYKDRLTVAQVQPLFDNTRLTKEEQLKIVKYVRDDTDGMLGRYEFYLLKYFIAKMAAKITVEFDSLNRVYRPKSHPENDKDDEDLEPWDYVNAQIRRAADKK